MLFTRDQYVLSCRENTLKEKKKKLGEKIICNFRAVLFNLDNSFIFIYIISFLKII